MNFLFTAGGTAGHINPAVAVAENIRRLMPDAKILFVGAEGQMETRRVPEAGFEIRTVKITNFQRSLRPEKILHNLKTLRNIAVSLTESRRIIREFAPSVAVGTGGYVCYPVLRSAVALGVPALLHESNAVPGLTTRMLAKHVDRVLVGFEESRKSYGDDKSVVTGTPVRMDFNSMDKTQAKAELGLAPDVPVVLSVWGSLGSSHMNAVISELIAKRADPGVGSDFHLIHATGEREYAQVLAKLERTPEQLRDCSVDLRDYIHNMPTVMAAADLVLCRAGASTLAELAVAGKPALLIPSPNVTNNHQERNARVLENARAAQVVLEGEFDAATLDHRICGLLTEQGTLADMAGNMLALAVPDAADRIAELALEFAERGKYK